MFYCQYLEADGEIMDLEKQKEFNRILTLLLSDDPKTLREAYLAEVVTDPAMQNQLREAWLAQGSEESLTDVIDGYVDQAFAGKGHRKTPANRTRKDGPTCIGAYAIEKKLGEGGMGTVYLAGRRENFQQKVALKVVNGAEPTMVKRFEKERRILASLSHPNIAAIYDGGQTDMGLPWLAMEFVAGRRLDTYCKEEALSIDERLALFLKICEAVSFAHGRLVIHRDIKPANILVTAQGEPKLLDFGIASVLSAQSEGGTAHLLTRALMTPGFASPEQVRCEPLGTATDVYSLGVVLYQLLTGKPLFTFKDQSPKSIYQVVCKQPIVPPSKRVSPKESRELKGDLDTIVLKAIERDLSRRYRSVEELAADIRAYLTDQPIAARPATLFYRTRKFLVRHRWPVLVASLFGLSLFAFFFTLVSQKAETEKQRARAEQESEAVGQVSDFLISMFELSEDDIARDEDITAKELLDRGRRRIVADLHGHSQVRARVVETLGQVYEKLGLYETAGSLVEEAVALHRDQGDTPEDLAESLLALATIQEKLGLYDKGLTLAEEAQALAHSVQDPLLVADTQQRMGVLLFNDGRYEDAEKQLREGFATRVQFLGEHHPQVAAMCNDLGLLLANQGLYEEAEQRYQAALAIYRAEPTGNRRNLAATLNNLGEMYRRMGNYEQAEAYTRETLAIRQELYGSEHPSIARSLNNLAALYFTQGKYTEAEDLFRQVLDIHRKTLGENHPDLARTYSNLSVLLYNRGEYDGAESFLRKALMIRRETFGQEHPEVAVTLVNLASVLVAKGDYEVGEKLFRLALSINRKSLGDEHANVAVILNNLGLLLLDQGKYQQAEPLFKEALATRTKILGNRHPRVAQSLGNLADLLHYTGRSEEGKVLIEQAIEIYEEHDPNGSRNLPVVRNIQAAIAADQAPTEETEAQLLASFTTLEETYKGKVSLRRAARRLVHFYTKRGDLSQVSAWKQRL